MRSPVDRRAVDLSAFPDLVVIYLGMRVRALGGVRTLLRLGPQIDKAGAGRPEGLLHFENNIIFSLFARWQNFLRSSGGTGFWHETYFMCGGMEAIYDDVNRAPLGFQAFAPSIPARGPMFSARRRLHVAGETPPQPAGVAEPDLYQVGGPERGAA